MRDCAVSARLRLRWRMHNLRYLFGYCYALAVFIFIGAVFTQSILGGIFISLLCLPMAIIGIRGFD